MDENGVYVALINNGVIVLFSKVTASFDVDAWLP
jgi:hypothetical protein